MPVYYDFYQNPSSHEDSKISKLHARVVTSETIRTDEISKEIQDYCTVTTADVKAVLAALTHVAIRSLKEGRRFHLDGFGFFQMTLSCPPIQTAKEIRAESIRFKSVVFRPEKRLKDKLRGSFFERVQEKRHSKQRSDTEITELLTCYFSKHESINRRNFQWLCGFTRSTALRKIKQLLVDGKLKKSGLHKFPVYVPAKGHFNR